MHHLIVLVASHMNYFVGYKQSLGLKGYNLNDWTKTNVSEQIYEDKAYLFNTWRPWYFYGHWKCFHFNFS